MATLASRSTDSWNDGGGRDEGNSGLGQKHMRLYFTDIDNAETHDTGLKSLRRVAFEPDESSDDVVVTQSAGVVTFTVQNGSAHSGTVHLWHRGY